MSAIPSLLILLFGQADPALRAAEAIVCRMVERPAAETWGKVVDSGPPALMPLLNRWPAEGSIAEKWVSSAFSEILSRQPCGLPKEEMILFASDPGRSGKARRMALQAVEVARPGVTRSMLRGWLDDPEFGGEAADWLVEQATSRDGKGAIPELNRAFHSTNNQEAIFRISRRLAELGEPVDSMTRLGVIKQWRLAGPFPLTNAERQAKPLLPEMATNPRASYLGEEGRLVSWKSVRVDPETCRTDLASHGISATNGAVAYASSAIRREKAGHVELRCCADDGITVWVAGKKVVEKASDIGGALRLDRYSARLILPAGETPILVKLTKTGPDQGSGRPAASEARWEFQVRVIDVAGPILLEIAGKNP
ncbi:MAG: hypothetical protein ACKO9Z_17855 [Planctomycetota bacterium]